MDEFVMKLYDFRGILKKNFEVKIVIRLSTNIFDLFLTVAFDFG